MEERNKKSALKSPEQALGYVFKNKALLRQALTHCSITTDIHCNYERLEFLGDRILGVIIADLLCKTFYDEPEGALAQRFVTLVCKETVAEVMRDIGIKPFIIAANPEVCEKDSILCDIGEALIAAVYIDSNGIEQPKEIITRLWLPHIDKSSQPKKDYKTMLQEKAAELKLQIPEYSVIAKTGPEHSPFFTVRLCIGSNYTSEGKGTNKKHAEQEAAKKMLQKLGLINDK